ncbi:hypothetical protein [Deinococcus pimensis]|uniref:hypothetical protein n=1 Tax=Deinococcus pimensis TaxID=309888 RepID=UPI00146F965F|nr:hypothetical protein [Deinococcus pimensis]
MPRLKTLSLRTLLTSRDHLPLRPDDRVEHLLERFRVTFHAGRVSKGWCQLQRGNLVLWLLNGTLHSVELTRSAGHEPSDVVDWCGFSMHDGDPLAWCHEHDIDLSLDREENGTQLWSTPSGARIALQDGRLWNITLVL